MRKNQEIIFFYQSSHPFSNFYPATFPADERLFHCAEQYIMYRKAKHFKDIAILEKIMQVHTPKECKQLGRQVRNFDENAWASIRPEVAYSALLYKFRAHNKLMLLLLATGDALLAEASPQDRIWGIGYSAETAPKDMQMWGENILGKALMKVRQDLSEETR